MRIVINGRFLSQTTTGVQRVAREFSRALDLLLSEGALPGVEARILVPPGSDLRDLDLRTITVREVGRLRQHAWEQFVLPWHIGDEILLNLGNTAPVLSLLGRRRVAVVLHDISYRLFPAAYTRRYRSAHRLLNVLLIRKADPIFTVAQTEASMIAHFYPMAKDRIVVAQNGGWSDDTPATALPVTGGAAAYGLYVGSLSRRKNIDGVLKTAITLARSRRLPFRIVGAESRILSAVEKAIPDDVRSLITFCGQIEDAEQLKLLYRDAALLLFPSFYEASALPPIEAMAQGCPVIVSDIPSLRERCGDAALYCDPKHSASLTAAVERVLDDPALAGDLRARGLLHAQRFTWRVQALKVVDALRASGFDGM